MSDSKPLILHVIPSARTSTDRVELAMERVHELYNVDFATVVLCEKQTHVHRHMKLWEARLLSIPMSDSDISCDIVGGVERSLEIAKESLEPAVIVIHADATAEIADVVMDEQRLDGAKVILFQQKLGTPLMSAPFIGSVPADVDLSMERALDAYVGGLV